MLPTHSQQQHCLVQAPQLPSYHACPAAMGNVGSATRRRSLGQQRLLSFQSPQQNSRLCGCRAKLGTPRSYASSLVIYPCPSGHQQMYGSAGQQDSGAAPDLQDNTRQQRKQQSTRQIMLSPSLAKILYKRSLKSLASLPLAIGELFLLAGLSAIGTIIEQNKPLQFYLDAYPDGANKVLGFLTYNWIFALQWDHIYTSNYFLGLMALLGASLAACTSTRQLPMVKVARR